jgi:hypothetical protein
MLRLNSQDKPCIAVVGKAIEWSASGMSKNLSCNVPA